MLTPEQLKMMTEELEKFALETSPEDDEYVLRRRDLITARGELLRVKKEANELCPRKEGEKDIGVTAQNNWIANYIRQAKYEYQDAENEAQIAAYKWNKRKEQINVIKYLTREK